MLDASTILLEYVCPCAGMILANMMFSAPFRDLQRAVSIGNLGSLNCTPWAFMLGNCFGWVLYGILRKNFWVYFANAPGFLMSVWLNLGAVKLLYQRHHGTALRSSVVEYLETQHQQQQHHQELLPEPTSVVVAVSTTTTTKDNDSYWAKIVLEVTSQTTPAPTPHERLVLIVVLIWMAIASLVGFAGSTEWIAWDDSTGDSSSSPSNVTTQVVGYAVNLNLVFFYGAPLSTIWTVVKQRNAQSIHLPTLITNTLNSSFWLAYGLAVKDVFIVVPNGMGAALGAIQVVLLVLFPRHDHAATTIATTTTTSVDANGNATKNVVLAGTDGSSEGDGPQSLTTVAAAGVSALKNVVENDLESANAVRKDR